MPHLTDEEPGHDLLLSNRGLIYMLAGRYRRRGVDVEDLAQEAAVACLTHHAKCDRAHVGLWIGWQVRGAAQKLLRLDRLKLTSLDALDNLQPAGPPSTDPLEQAEELDAIHSALDRLTPQDRETIAERFGLDGRDVTTMADIAKRRGVTLSAVQQKVSRALDRLRAALIENKDFNFDAGKHRRERCRSDFDRREEEFRARLRLLGISIAEKGGVA